MNLVCKNTKLHVAKKYLEKVLNQDIKSFAYPYGNFNKQTLPIIKKTGFDCACATVEETVWKWSNSFQLPRFEVIDWDGQIFENNLLNWLKNE